jgi:predicted O-methyltransferase YrrM
MSRKLDLSPLGYQFTRSWFLNRNLPTFREFVYPEWANKPCTYLEIGVFEGQSLCWMLEHVLTHKDSRGVGVDPWLMTTKLNEADMEAVRLRAAHNVSKWEHGSLVRGASAEVLRKMAGRGHAGISKGSVDLCMIDGNHWAPYVVDDAEQVATLLKPGGWMLFDDYSNDIPKKDHVKQGLEMFLASHTKFEFTELWRHRYMVCLKKEHDETTHPKSLQHRRGFGT